MEEEEEELVSVSSEDETSTEWYTDKKKKIKFSSYMRKFRMVFFNRNNHRVDRVIGLLTSRPNWLPSPPHPRPETHIQRQAALHDCLKRLLFDGDT